MDAGRSFHVASVAEAAAALDYFNGFHDGFMKRIVITSHDTFGAGTRRHDQVVHGEFRGEFRGVQDPCCDLREALYSAPVISVRIDAATRPHASTTTRESRLALVVLRNYYLAEARRWETRETPMFTFAEARSREPSPGGEKERDEP